MANDAADSSATPHVCSECRSADRLKTPDYYWRDYIDTIPYDALSSGLDLNGRKTYTGQAYLYKYGVLPGTIYPGNSAINVSSNSYVSPAKVAKKVLCSSNPDCFTWEPATSENLHAITIGKHLVVGGYEHDQIVNVGRVMYQGMLIVGRVAGYDAEKAKLFFVHGGKEISVNSYEVLVYNHRRES